MYSSFSIFGLRALAAYRVQLCFWSALLLLSSAGRVSAATPALTCTQEYIAAFDAIDASYEQILIENLDSAKSNTVTGADATAMLSSLIGGYNCQLKMACNLVLRAGKELENSDARTWKNRKFSFPECADTFTWVAQGQERVKLPATWGNALQFFGRGTTLASCSETTTALDSWQQCEAVRRTKITMELAKLSSAMRTSAAAKRSGFLLGKLEELHSKMIGKNGDGLINSARSFMQKLKKVLEQASCTVPQTVTK